jgi:hypothetical protein
MAILRPLFGTVFPLFYEEARVTRYIVLPESVGGFTIPNPDTLINDLHADPFDAPGLVPGSLPVIFLGSTPHTAKASFDVFLENPMTQLITHTFAAESAPHDWHKVIPPNALKPEGNQLTFAVSEGSITFSDVVILYTSNQLTVKRPAQIVAHP